MRLGRIIIFPIKSLDGITRESVRVTSGGILEGDRIHAMFDKAGRVVNGKRTARVHRLRSAFDETLSEVTLWEEGTTERARFNLAEPGPIGEWLTRFFGFPIFLRTDTERGFPDDESVSGPTLTTEASLRAVTKWFPGMDVESARRRFRTNLEFTDCEAFAEDALFGGPGERVAFRVGGVNFLGHNPCQRCPVPVRDPDTGKAWPKFVQIFMRRREETLPPWAARARFNHFYRFALNTSVPASEAGQTLRVGDEVSR